MALEHSKPEVAQTLQWRHSTHFAV